MTPAKPCTCPNCKGRATREVCIVERLGSGGTWLRIEQHLVRCWAPGGLYSSTSGKRVMRSEPCPVVVLVELPALEPA